LRQRNRGIGLDPASRFVERMDDNPAIADGQIMARSLGPRAAVEVRNRAIDFCHGKVSVPATDGIATEFPSVRNRFLLDLLGTTQEDLATFLRHTRDMVRLVDALQHAIHAVRKPRRPRVRFDEFVEAVPVEEKNRSPTGFENVFLNDIDTDQLREVLERPVVISVEPNDRHIVGHFAQQREHLPMVLTETAKVDRIEDVAVEDQALGFPIAVANRFEKFDEQLGLAVLAPQVQIGYHNRVGHE